jgi:hypothetical protein
MMMMAIACTSSKSLFWTLPSSLLTKEEISAMVGHTNPEVGWLAVCMHQFMDSRNQKHTYWQLSLVFNLAACW